MLLLQSCSLHGASTLTEVLNVLFRARMLSDKVEVCIKLCHPARGPSCGGKQATFST